MYDTFSYTPILFQLVYTIYVNLNQLYAPKGMLYYECYYNKGTVVLRKCRMK